MRFLAIDPGQFESAYVLYDMDMDLFSAGMLPNPDMKRYIKELSITNQIKLCAIENPKSFGNQIGDSVLETCIWIGKFVENCSGIEVMLIPRKSICHVVCNNVTANDTAIKQTIIDRYGGKRKAVGDKFNPGIFFGFTNDMWQAFGVVLYYIDKFHYKDNI